MFNGVIKVLLYEHLRNSNAIFKSHLQTNDFDVICAGSADECIACAEQNKFDLILLNRTSDSPDDINLIITAIRNSRQMNRTALFVLIDKTMVSDMEKAFSAGMDDYIVRPADIIYLPAMIRAKYQRYLNRACTETVK